MNDVEPDFLSQLDAVFAQLNPQAVEEFYAAYHQWSLRQRIAGLRQRIDAVREQQADNQQRLRETRPTTIALAALARLQSNGVSDIALLDAMLERGESWLDQTMQRLDYFEQFDDFISDDYTKWCQGALEGAFDWIDSLRESTEQAVSTQLASSSAEEPPNTEDTGEVEALLLQRLASEDEQDGLSWQEAITLKQTAIKPPPPEIVTTGAEKQEPPAQDGVAQQTAETQAHETLESPTPNPLIVEAGADAEKGGDPRDRPGISSVPENELEPAPLSVPDQLPSVPENELEPTTISVPDQPAIVEFVPIEESAPEEDELHTEDNQPALVESAPIEEPSLTESELYTMDEQPAFVEFVAPSEPSPPEEIYGQVTEQAAPTETTMPEDIPAPAYAAQREVSEPGEIENSASYEASQHKQQPIATGEIIMPDRSTPRKRGLIRSLIWIITGK